MNCPPGPSLLNGERSVNRTWLQVLSELIDNSFDAGGLKVTIAFGPGRHLCVSDDGRGCDSPEAMLTLGKHYRHPSTRLGRYGIGLKKAACWLWGTMHIETVTGNHRYIFSVTWPELAKQAEWDIPDPIVTSSNGERGTRITFSQIVHRLPNPADYVRLADDLGYTFAPGLLRGYQIRLTFPKRKPIVAKPYQLPPLEDVIQDEFRLDDRGVRLHVGIVQEEHENPRPGFAYCHHHRVIITSALGAGEYSTSRIAGQVFLDDSWHLSAHKDDISSRKEELGESIFQRCQVILGKAQRQATAVSSQAFDKKLNEQLHAAVKNLARNKKARRKPPENANGAIEPKDGTKKHKRARRTQHGDRLSDEQIGKLRIDWKAIEAETLGDVDFDGARIWLNSRNAYLERLRQKENDAALLNTALGIYVNAAVHSGEIQKYLPGVASEYDTRFVAMWSRVLSSIAELKE